MGAWIEIALSNLASALSHVAPYMGAWIEIVTLTYSDYFLPESHPTWVRGLKFQEGKPIYNSDISRTLHGCVD